MGWGQKLMAAAGSLIGTVGGPAGMGVGGMLGGLAGDALFGDDEEGGAVQGYQKQRAKQAFTPVQAPNIPSVGTQAAPLQQQPMMEDDPQSAKKKAASVYLSKMGGQR